MARTISLLFAAFSAGALAQVNPNSAFNGSILYDTVKYGPEIELQHLYYDEFPTGTRCSGGDMNGTKTTSRDRRLERGPQVQQLSAWS